MLVAGEWTDALDGQRIDVENPGRRTIVATVPRAQQADVDKAVAAAKQAFGSWRTVAPRDRGKLLIKIAEQLETRIEPMAQTIAMETGNAIRTQARP